MENARVYIAAHFSRGTLEGSTEAKPGPSAMQAISWETAQLLPFALRVLQWLRRTPREPAEATGKMISVAASAPWKQLSEQWLEDPRKRKPMNSVG